LKRITQLLNPRHGERFLRSNLRTDRTEIAVSQKALAMLA
jgi:hypothetical protein